MEDFVDQWRVYFNSHDLSGFASMYAPEGTYMTPGMIYFVRSREDLRRALDALWRKYPDIQITETRFHVVDSSKLAFVWDLEYMGPARRTETQRGATFIEFGEGGVTHQLTVVSR